MTVQPPQTPRARSATSQTDRPGTGEERPLLAEGEGIEPPRDSRPGYRFRSEHLATRSALQRAITARAGRAQGTKCRAPSGGCEIRTRVPREGPRLSKPVHWAALPTLHAAMRRRSVHRVVPVPGLEPGRPYRDTSSSSWRVCHSARRASPRAVRPAGVAPPCVVGRLADRPAPPGTARLRCPSASGSRPAPTLASPGVTGLRSAGERAGRTARLEVTTGVEPAWTGFAGRCLATQPRHHCDPRIASCPSRGSNPHTPFGALDPESSASTKFRQVGVSGPARGRTERGPGDSRGAESRAESARFELAWDRCPACFPSRCHRPLGEPSSA